MVQSFGSLELPNKHDFLPHHVVNQRAASASNEALHATHCLRRLSAIQFHDFDEYMHALTAEAVHVDNLV